MNRSTFKNLTKITPYFISAASLTFAAQFLYHTIDSSFSSENIIWVFLSISISLLVFIGLRAEFKSVEKAMVNKADFQIANLLKIMLIIVSSAMITYFITNVFDTSTIFSASLVCVIYTFLFSDFQAEAYSGSVAGMIGAYLCGHWSVALVTALMTFLVCILFKPYFKGVGGRGGAIPYVATTLAVRVLFKLEPTKSQPINSDLILPMFFVLLLTAVLTYYLHDKGLLTVVQSAMIVALVFSIILPSHLKTLTTTIFAGTILGMSTSERIDNYFHLMLVASICFILFIPSYHLLDGIGGKLGILSFLSYYGSVGLKNTFLSRFTQKTNILNQP